MKITKETLCALPFCYAVTTLQRDGKTYYLMATDGQGPCYAFDSETLERETVWEGPGGTMSLVEIPGSNGEFLAVQNFMPGFQAAGAEIVHVKKAGDGWHVSTWVKIPYIHRFDILGRGGVRYVLFCTLCTTKKDENDWSSPGGLYVAQLPDDFSTPPELKQIAGGMTCNHGYCKVERDGWSWALTACDQGLYEVCPPEHPGGEWEVKQIMSHRISDSALCDIDGDGEEELATIEPFHGNAFVVYKKKDGAYQEIYRYPNKMAFCHVVWGGTLRGEPVFLGGCRAEEKELFLLRWKDGKIQEEILEKGKGPSNVAVVHGAKRDTILTANRESGECALFHAED